MRAHIIENGTVVNTIVVKSLDVFPNLIDASNGGAIGDDWDGQAFSTPAVVPVVPQSVSRFQARMALRNAGLFEAVEAAMSDPGTPIIAVEAWQTGQEFLRTSATVGMMAAALGLNDADLDQLFIAAAGIVA